MNSDINQEILSELRKLRLNSQIAAWLALVTLAAGIVVVTAAAAYAVVIRFQRHKARVSTQQTQPGAWDEVNAAVDRLDHSKALSLAQAVTARQTNYWYGHSYLGSIYLALGDPTNAEVHYLRAYELWPDKENEENLAAIRKRLARESLTRNE